MARARGRRKRKWEGKAEASGSGNARNVAQKAGKRKTGSVSWEEEVPATRSVRERKAVVRFVPGQPNEKSPKSKDFSIEQGPGTKLQDIPNVVFKLSKRKADENLQVLHTILYGRESNESSWKKNILQFSGFVWAENKGKEWAKVKEQLDKCNKERLLLFCELLDIPDMKATTEKEEVSARLLEFLESPHVTRNVVLAENVQRGRKRKSIKESSHRAYGETLSNIKNKKQKKSPSKEVNPNKGSSKEPMKRGSKAKLKEKAVSVKKNSVKITKITSKKSAAVNNRDSGQSSTFNPQRKGKKDGRNDEKQATVVKKTVGKKAANSASNVSTKGNGKMKVRRKPPREPTEEEIRTAINDLEDEVGFQEVSATDLFRKLEARFKMDLRHRKEEINRMLYDVFTDASEDDQDNDADASRGEDAERSGEDTEEEEDAESSGEDTEEEEDAEGPGEDAGEEDDAEGSGEDAGEEDDAEGSGEDAGEEDDAEGSGEDAEEEENAEGPGEDAGEEDDAEGSGEDAGEEDDAEGSGEDAEEEEDAEGPGEDAGEEDDAEASGEDAGEEERMQKDQVRRLEKTRTQKGRRRSVG